jgi:ABC-type Fe3+/spermidine/putrescine transport system ATPase subunit
MVRPEKIRLLEPGEDHPTAVQGVVREVVYLGSVTRYVVDTDRGETLVVMRQNLDTSAEKALKERGRAVRLAWRAEDASVLDTNEEKEVKP